MEDSELYSGDFTVLSSEAQQALRFPTEECRLVLVGKTGNGKSATANHLCGEKHFEVGEGMCSTTMKCRWGQVFRFGVSVEIVDTPGVFDTNIDDAVVSKELARCLGHVAPGPHAVLFVVRLDVVFTLQEAEVKTYLCSLFGDGILNHVIVVFTHGDCMGGKAIMEFLRSCPPALKELLELTCYRYVVFDNTLELESKGNDRQVKQLLEAVRDLLTHTDNSHFTNPFLTRFQEIVVANTKDIARMLERDPNSRQVRELVMLGLQAKDNLEEILDNTLEVQAEDSQQLDELKKTLQAVLREKKMLEKEIQTRVEHTTNIQTELDILKTVLKNKDESIQKLNDELQKEQKVKIKCTIL